MQTLQSLRHKDVFLGRRIASLDRLEQAGVSIPTCNIMTPDFFCGMNEAVIQQRLQYDIDYMCRYDKSSNTLFNIGLSPLVWQKNTVQVENFVQSFSNVGFNSETVSVLRASYNPRQVLRAYYTYLYEYATRVYGIRHLQKCDIQSIKAVRDLEEKIDALKSEIENHGDPVPEDLNTQILEVVKALSREWQSPRQQILRSAHGLSVDLQSAVVIQDAFPDQFLTNAWSGWIYTHDPMSGEPKLTTPDGQRLSGKIIKDYQLITLSYQGQSALCDALGLYVVFAESSLKVMDVQSLQRSGKAAVEITVDLAERGIISIEDAILDVKPSALEAYLHPTLIHKADYNCIANGLPASPGAVVGEIVFSTRAAETAQSKGVSCILVQPETTPDDIRGLYAANGILTMRGGLSSHAAVIARGIGRPCVVGVNTLQFDKYEKILQTNNGLTLREGDIITLDGTSGTILLGQADVQPAFLTGAFAKVMEWSDDFRAIKVLANADTIEDAKIADQFHADGIGLCRTEHMFLNEDCLSIMQSLIFTLEPQNRQSSLQELEDLLTEKLLGLLAFMDEKPVTIRLLDIPLHEFMPRSVDQQERLAQRMNIPLRILEQRIKVFEEVNPMLGKRGCRLGLLNSDIYAVQIQAIFKTVKKLESKIKICPEIMIPLVSGVEEVRLLSDFVKVIASQYDLKSDYKFGIMVETPRAALCAGEISQYIDFMSFGTNDLTQMVFGLSRDDAGQFMKDYLDLGIWGKDPFQTIDTAGVGILLQSAIKQVTQDGQRIQIGLCGEHGGDPQSIHFCVENGIDYVSCSPYRIPIARLAAAQASILKKSDNIQ
jgi:pyruvate,orthophosphate dikinase